MALVSLTRGYIGKGPVRLRARDGSADPFELGNVTSLQTNVNMDRKARVDFQAAGGGELDVNERITSYAGKISIDDFKPQVLALALRGSVTAQASLAVSNEKLRAFAGQRSFFATIPDPTQTVTVTVDGGTWAGTTAYAAGAVLINTTHAYVATTGGTSGASAPTWPTTGSTVTDGTVVWKDVGLAALVKDTHYSLSGGGLKALDGMAGYFVAPAGVGLPISVSYTRNAQYLIQALVNSGTEYEMVLEGLNENDSGNPVIFTNYRVKFSPTSGLDRIGDSYGKLDLNFTVLKDTTITTAGLSQYEKIQMI